MELNELVTEVMRPYQQMKEHVCRDTPREDAIQILHVKFEQGPDAVCPVFFEREMIHKALDLLLEEHGGTPKYVCHLADAYTRSFTKEEKEAEGEPGRDVLGDAFHRGDSRVSECLVATVLDVQKHEFVTRTVPYGYDEAGVPVFGEPVEVEAVAVRGTIGVIPDEMMAGIYKEGGSWPTATFSA